MTAVPRFTRSRILEQARVHHLLSTFSALHYSMGPSGSSWSGDARAGGYFYDNGCGDYYRLCWTPSSLIALVFAHESDRSEYNTDASARSPLRWLAGLPASLTWWATAATFEDLCFIKGSIRRGDRTRVPSWPGSATCWVWSRRWAPRRLGRSSNSS